MDIVIVTKHTIVHTQRNNDCSHICLTIWRKVRFCLRKRCILQAKRRLLLLHGSSNLCRRQIWSSQRANTMQVTKFLVLCFKNTLVYTTVLYWEQDLANPITSFQLVPCQSLPIGGTRGRLESKKSRRVRFPYGFTSSSCHHLSGNGFASWQWPLISISSLLLLLLFISHSRINLQNQTKINFLTPVSKWSQSTQTHKGNLIQTYSNIQVF